MRGGAENSWDSLPAALHAAELLATLATDKGAFNVYLRGADLMYTQGVGYIGAELARALCELAVQRLGAAPRAAYFHDWAGLTGYDTQARKIITQWALRENNIACILVLTRSQLLAMGVSAFELALEAFGRRVPVRACTSRAAFIAELVAYTSDA